MAATSNTSTTSTNGNNIGSNGKRAHSSSSSSSSSSLSSSPLSLTKQTKRRRVDGCDNTTDSVHKESGHHHDTKDGINTHTSSSSGSSRLAMSNGIRVKRETNVARRVMSRQSNDSLIRYNNSNRSHIHQVCMYVCLLCYTMPMIAPIHYIGGVLTYQSLINQ
jgi:hypothetical protein